MRKLLIVLSFLLLPVFANAQEVTSNTWASWANISSTQVNWIFPYSSRGITIMNGSSNVICVTFDKNAVITPSCSDQYNSNVNNGVFQVGANTFIYIDNLRRPEIHFMAPGASASPVSVIVNY